jgi:hypothetical protein
MRRFNLEHLNNYSRVMRCCSGLLGRLLGVKTSVELDRPVATTHENQKILALKALFTSPTPVGSAANAELTLPKAFGLVSMAIWILGALPQVRPGESILWRTRF